MSRKPRVIQDSESGITGEVDLGWLYKALIAAGAIGAFTALLGVPLLGLRVSTAEENVTTLIADVARQERNQSALDTNQRILMQESLWAQYKLDALLEVNGVTKRIRKPPLPKTALEKPAPPASTTE